MEMVLIPAGKGWFGEGAEQKEIVIGEPFYLGKYEVTRAEWGRVMGTKPWFGGPRIRSRRGRGNGGAPNSGRIPATDVSWYDVQEFCKKLGAMDGCSYCLPSEEEWEYACRAGARTTFSFGNSEADLGKYAWYQKNTVDVGEEYPHPVGAKKPNAFGLYDMHGNVQEWCYDEDKLSPAHSRVIRGGRWDDLALMCRSAYKIAATPSLTESTIGFRVLRVP
jgi:formylglycine-generating enzyme required for sulfatase activity